MSQELKHVWLFIVNLIITMQWYRVASLFVYDGGHGLLDVDTCLENLRPNVIRALMFSTVELFNSLVGFTRSKPSQVLLFSSVRMGVEYFTAPSIPCTAWQHLLTCLCWALGDVVRFGCFAVDILYTIFGQRPPHMIKSLRYTVGPILFPLGALGEMLIVVRSAQDRRPILFVAASLWPVGFYPLMKQLLRQRRRHFETLSKDKKKPKVKFM